MRSGWPLLSLLLGLPVLAAPLTQSSNGTVPEGSEILPASEPEDGDGALRIVTKPRGVAPPAEASEASPSTAPTTAKAPAPTPSDEMDETIAETDWPEVLHRAHEAYGQGDYERAGSLYGRLIASGLANGHLYYNLANSRVRSGRLGRGIAAYLHSARLLPRDQDVQANLDYARRSIKDAIEPVQPSALSRTLLFWHHKLSQSETLLLAGLVSSLFWVGLIVRIFRRESEALRWTVVGLFIVLLALGGSLAVRVAWPVEVAVITRPEMKVRSATAREATVLFELHEGTEVEAIGEQSGWLKVRLADGKRGWLKAEGVEVVK